MSSDSNKHPEPPQPPQFVRKFQLYPHQYITIPLLFLIPVLALLGVFGETRTEAQQSADDLSVKVDYFTRSRYKLLTPLSVEITSDNAYETLNVYFDREYIDAFSEVRFKPDVKIVTGDAYIVELTGIEAGETVVVAVELQAEEYGQFDGHVRVEAGDETRVEVPVSTFLFP